jgi:hypothetical protein
LCRVRARFCYFIHRPMNGYPAATRSDLFAGSLNDVLAGVALSGQ